MDDGGNRVIMGIRMVVAWYMVSVGDMCGGCGWRVCWMLVWVCVRVGVLWDVGGMYVIVVVVIVVRLP